MALRHFSHAASKTTGSAHPKDRGRWLRFLSLAHADAKQMDPARLARRLTEIEGWDGGTVHGLIAEYEFALELLNEHALRPNG